MAPSGLGRRAAHLASQSPAILAIIVRQLPLSETGVNERPAQVCEWLEVMLRGQLLLVHPADRVRREIASRTPGPLRTRVIDDWVEPQI